MNRIFTILFLMVSFTLSAQEPIDTDGDGFRNVSTLEHLRWISEKSDSITEWYIELDNNINAADTRNWNVGDHDNNPETPDSAMGWMPIGYQKRGYTQWNKNISGTINGNGYVIDSLYCNMPYDANVAFIAFAKEYSLSIHDLGITNCSIRGSNTAALVAWNGGHLIENCFSTGKIVSHGNSAGGLVAHHFRGDIKNCYSQCDVRSERIHAVTNSGGLVGSVNIADIENSYSTGKVIGDYEQGGFIGEVYSVDITSCFWDMETSGMNNAVGYSSKDIENVTGKTTAEMKTKSTFTDADWDFENVWNIADTINNSYPYLNGFDYPTTVQENKIALDWIQMPRYRYMELDKGIEKIEVNNKKDSVILAYKNDLQILDIHLDSILVDIEPPEDCNEIYLNPDLKSYVMIYEQYYSEMNYYEFYHTNTQEMFSDGWIKYEGFGQGNNTWRFGCIYPYYNYKIKDQKILHGKSETINDTYFTDYSSECADYYFSRDNRFRLVDSKSSEDFYRKDYSEKHSENQSFYMIDLLKDTSKNLYSSKLRKLKYYDPKDGDGYSTFEEEGIFIDYAIFDNNGFAFLQSNNRIYKFDLEVFDIVDTISIIKKIEGFGYHKDNLLFTSGNTLYYYDSNEKRISKKLTFDFDFNYSVITSTDSTIIMGCKNYTSYNNQYYYYLVHLKISDMEEFFESGFYASRDTVVIGDTVNFESYFEYSNIEYLWDFGDGYTSNDINPKHIYKNVGSYDVSLTLTNGKDTSITKKENYITVLQVSNVSESKHLLSIYPNPASDYIEISINQPSEDSEIEIYDVLGNKVMAIVDVQHLGDVGHLERIDISHLPKGIYFVKIGDKVEKFVKY